MSTCYEMGQLTRHLLYRRFILNIKISFSCETDQVNYRKEVMIKNESTSRVSWSQGNLRKSSFESASSSCSSRRSSRCSSCFCFLRKYLRNRNDQAQHYNQRRVHLRASEEATRFLFFLPGLSPPGNICARRRRPGTGRPAAALTRQ